MTFGNISHDNVEIRNILAGTIFGCEIIFVGFISIFNYVYPANKVTDAKYTCTWPIISSFFSTSSFGMIGLILCKISI